MMDYNKRVKEAFDMIPSHRQREVLEELEHKAYNQDFRPKFLDSVDTQEQDYPEDKLAELLADGLINLTEFLVDAIMGVGVLYKLIRNRKESK